MAREGRGRGRAGKCGGERIYSRGLLLADLRRVWRRAGYGDLGRSDPAFGTRMRWVVLSVIGARSSASTRSAFRRRGATCALPLARVATSRHGDSTRAIESNTAIMTGPWSVASGASTTA